jgi:hypothetical protein
MDAATLYMVLTLPNGEQRTSTQEFSTVRACEVQADLRQRGGPIYPKRPGSTTEYRCKAHKPIFLLVAYKWGRGRPQKSVTDRDAAAEQNET